jgi:hypothetical protein
MRVPDRADPNIWDDVERLREWTIDQLHRVDLIEFPEDYDYPIDRSDRRAFQLQCVIFDCEGEKQIQKELRRCKRDDPDHYYQIITDSPDLIGYVQTRRGRPKGHAPGLELARGEIARIRQLWRQAFGKVYKKDGTLFPLAVEIAAERHGLTPRELDDYRKNRTPSKRI